MTLGVTRRSQVGRSSQAAIQPPSSSCSSRMPGSQSAAVPASGSRGSSPAGRTRTSWTTARDASASAACCSRARAAVPARRLRGDLRGRAPR